jgi:hypothetical protein
MGNLKVHNHSRGGILISIPTVIVIPQSEGFVRKTSNAVVTEK